MWVEVGRARAGRVAGRVRSVSGAMRLATPRNDVVGWVATRVAAIDWALAPAVRRCALSPRPKVRTLSRSAMNNSIFYLLF